MINPEEKSSTAVDVARRILAEIDAQIAAAAAGDDALKVTIRMTVMGGLLGAIQRLGGPGAADFTLGHLWAISDSARSSMPQSH